MDGGEAADGPGAGEEVVGGIFCAETEFDRVALPTLGTKDWKGERGERGRGTSCFKLVR